MEWLWRDWTEPLSAGRSQNDMLQSLVVEGEGWEVADGKVEFPDHSLMKTSEGFVFGEKGGPSTAISPDHRVLVEAERNSDCLWRELSQPTARWLTDSGSIGFTMWSIAQIRRCVK
uniref:hypothetical protein n=1 Tax=Candidatus Limisoma sp. TaxID=3076476 RepID=UPI0040280A37